MTEPTIYGIGATEYQPQPNFSAWQTETGAWQARQSFICREGALSDDAFRNKFTAGVAPSSLDEAIDSYWNTLGLSRVNWRNKPGGLAEIDVHYAGFTATAIAPQYDLDVETSRISMMEHPDIIVLDEDERTFLDKVHRGKIAWDGTQWTDEWLFPHDGPPGAPPSADSVTFGKLISGGKKFFSLKTLVWTKRWSDDTGFTAAEVGKIGEIDSSVPGSPPTPTGTRNWIVSDIRQTSTGKLYRKTMSWTMSVEGGWNSSIYTL